MKLINIAKETKRFLSFRRHIYRLRKQEYLDIDSKPKVLNLNIIDICNSKCTMCNIWRRDQQKEVTPDELRKILSDPLYKELMHVGVTGGEPTLREDLPEVYKAIIESLPNLKGVSIITNAINKDDVLSRIEEVKKICDANNIAFSAMVSIDGVGKVHDNVRGTKGNFETSIEVFKYLRDTLKIPASFGCTISKINIWDAEDLLHYAIENNMYGRFRVAETINRLYNQNRSKVIRNFDDDESYNLVLFYEKLKRKFERNETIQRTYSSIQHMLLGGERLIGCPYHNSGIVLGSKGQINYCAPKSKDIGNGLEESSLKIYKDKFAEKQSIFENSCKDCIHDYHAPITSGERKIQMKEYYYNKLLNIGQHKKAEYLSRFLKKVPKESHRYRVFIFGWYGTETVGDKAILGGIVDHFKDKYGERLEVVVGSLYPFITEKTCNELNINATVVSTRSFDLLKYSKSSDEVVMGGGPLMDLEELYVPYIGFRVARKFGKITSVFGCGIGPLFKQHFEEVVQDILSNATNIMLRDQKSVNIARKWGMDRAMKSDDYAKTYLENNFEYNKYAASEDQTLTCFLREWTYEYSRDLTKEQFEVEKMKFERGIVSLIKSKAKELGVKKVYLEHMHNFVLGNDDRDFSRYFIEKYFSTEDEFEITFNKKLSTVDSIVSAMISSKHNICMRFHSVLFAHTLGTSFTAIDYTKGGKILNYLTDNDSLHNMYSVDDLVKL